MALNPFAFGALALDAAFADRERELAELTRDMRNGQDVLLVAPRRYGKSSLVLRAIEAVVAEDMLVAYCDLMRTPTKERFAGALAKTIVDDLDSPVGQVLDRAAALFRGLRSAPGDASWTRTMRASASRSMRPGAGRTSTTRSRSCSSCRAGSAPSGSAGWFSCSTSSRRW